MLLLISYISSTEKQVIFDVHGAYHYSINYDVSLDLIYIKAKSL